MSFRTLDTIAKIHNGGNSFAVILTDNSQIPENSIQSICLNFDGSTTDGLVLIRDIGSNTWQLRFFNADGSSFRMCFNGTFCAAKFLKNFLGITSKIKFVTNVGDIAVDVKKNVTLKFFFEKPIISEVKLSLKPSWKSYFIQMTDNHLVVLPEKNYFYQLDFVDEAKKIRYAQEFLPDGTNVHFASIVNNTVFIRHFEKGIEKETLSCGSGCLATGLLLKQKNLSFISRGGKIILKNDGKSGWVMTSSPKLLKQSK